MEKNKNKTNFSIVDTQSASTLEVGKGFTSLIKLPRVMELTTLSAPSVYRLAKEDDKFPKPFKISERASVWSEQEVMDYIESCMAQRDKEEV